MTIEQTVDLIKTGYVDPSQIREAELIIEAINQRVADALEQALVNSPPVRVPGLNNGTPGTE